jgi:hypothetical protein
LIAKQIAEALSTGDRKQELTTPFEDTSSTGYKTMETQATYAIGLCTRFRSFGRYFQSGKTAIQFIALKPWH